MLVNKWNHKQSTLLENNHNIYNIYKKKRKKFKPEAPCS